MSTKARAEAPPNSPSATELLANGNTGTSGSGWAGQSPGRTTDAFMSALLGSILQGLMESSSFNMKQLDHRAGFDRAAVSNKELVIHAGQLAGRKIENYAVAKLVVLDTLLRHAVVETPVKIDGSLMSSFGGEAMSAEATSDE